MMTDGTRILIILEAGDLYPSGYLRGLIHRENLNKYGFQFRYVGRLPVSLIRLSSQPPKLLRPFFHFGLRKVLSKLIKLVTFLKENYISHASKKFDIVYMSKVTSFRLVNRLRQRTNRRIIFDFGDALWLSRFGIDKFDKILTLVDSVTTDNEYTADYVRKFNKNCTVVPDSPQLELFDKKRHEAKRRNNMNITIGWIGSPSQAFNLFLIWEPLERVFSKYSNLHLRLVGVGSDYHNIPPFEKVKFSVNPHYSQNEMIEEVLKMDIGLFPLHDVEASLVRGVLKATVYMSGEVAVIASPIGECRDLIQDGFNGMLAKSNDEWESKLESLITNPDLRKRIAQAGLETVRRYYTLDNCFLKLLPVLRGENK